MTVGIFNFGTTPNDGTGDSVRKGALKLNKQPAVLSAALTAPPGSPADGDMYIIAATATGDWAGQEDDIAYYDNAASAWEFYTPTEGWRIWDANEKEMLVFTDGAWSDSAIGSGGGGGGVTSLVAQSVSFRGAMVYNVAGATGEDFSGAGQTFDFFDTEAYDLGAWADPGGANPERLTVPDGVTKVKLAGQIVLDNHATGGMVIALQKNGGNLTPHVTIRSENVGSSARASFATPTLEVSAGDIFTLLVVSEDGSADVAANSCWFAIEDVTPVVATSERSVCFGKLDTDQTGGDYSSSGVISWDDADNTKDTWWTAGNPTRFTVPSGVDRVEIVAQVGSGDHADANEPFAFINLNGSLIDPLVIGMGAIRPGGLGYAQVSSYQIDVTPGDYFELSYNSGGDTSVTIDADRTWFQIRSIVDGDPLGALIELTAANTGAQNAALIQAAIDGGQIDISLPAGTFDLAPVDLASGVSMRGQGIGETILTFPTQTITDVDGFGGVLNVHGTMGTHIENVVLEDFTIDGNKAGITVAGTTDANDIEGIDFLYADNCVTNRVRVINTVGDGLDYDNCYRCTNRDCEFEGTGGYGVHFSAGSAECTSYGLSAVDCGDDNSRGGFDTHASSSKCTYVNPKTNDCYRGGYIQGDHSQVIGHVSEADVNNGLRLAASFCRIDGDWLNTTSGNGMTIESGSEFNRVDGLARDASASGFNFLSGADRNSIGVTAEGNTGTGLVVQGDSNVMRGCVLVNNGTQFSNTGTDNLVGDQITA